ncbi:prohibitin family protein [Roseivirga misakiensis]|uniref:Spfh domain, band 7 family protein n=1 Tax=Roseivirga misakiensis TaxID=1563681 RepID=A0A1E5SL20_9BACT|nr:prohibitin family protein [Roseivirga misakiensis]OEJ99828.1 spfh domain, band 7 family protein [Roseivirga misakiensis]
MRLFIVLVLAVSLSSCAVIRPGEVGVKQKMGKLSDQSKASGSIWYNPLSSRVIKVSTQTENLELTISLPSKEGLSITSQISILYQVNAEKVTQVVEDLGLNFEPIIANIFRSASADVCSKYSAKDMHSGMRANIEGAIATRMSEILNDKGILIEEVLLKSIQLPAALANSIEQKLQAEQDALRMKFILDREKLEAERKLIAAKGTRDAQKILAEGLTKQILEFKSIEAFIELAKSQNSKVIITDGKTPYLIQNDK